MVLIDLRIVSKEILRDLWIVAGGQTGAETHPEVAA